MEFHPVKTVSEYEQFIEKNSMMSDDVLDLAKGNMAFKGFCEICGSETFFLIDHTFDHLSLDVTRKINRLYFRETFHCQRCGLNNRMRAAFSFLQRLPLGKIYITEQQGRFFQQLQARYADAQGSEYLPDVAFGSSRGGIRSEDCTQLTFSDASFNSIISQDVLEHVENYEAALREFHRVLKPEGHLLCSVPSVLHSWGHWERVKTLNGKLHYFCPPEYHGNPIANTGALCYRYFGMSFLQDLRDADFRDATCYLYNDLPHGHFGIGSIFLAQK
jgi:SAM-dependent methyltransferase